MAGGLENISAVQNEYHEWTGCTRDNTVTARSPHVYMLMLQTAEFVSKKYGTSRNAQDEYALRSQQRTAAAKKTNRLDAEIAPLASTMVVVDKATGQTTLAG